MDKIESRVEFISTYEPAFRRHYQLVYHDTGRSYEQYEPAYCLGYELVAIHGLGNRAWAGIEREARRQWESQGHELSWEEVRSAVEHGWNEAREGIGLQHYERYDDTFHAHHETTYASGRPYEYYEPAYRFGYHVAYDECYRNQPWEEIEPEVQREWESARRDAPWDEVKGAVHHAWREVQEAFALQS